MRTKKTRTKTQPRKVRRKKSHSKKWPKKSSTTNHIDLI